jgi:biopolymer transport protein ExbB
LALTLHGATWVLWLLVVLSIASLAVMIERIWFYTTDKVDESDLAADMRRLLAKHQAGEENEQAERAAKEALLGAMEGAKAKQRMRLERNLAYLATLGSNAPFVGLFGTVLGIIKAFHDLAGNQGGGPSIVMAGISEALVATAIGLMVAIPAVVAFNYFSRRVKAKMTDVDWIAHLAMARVSSELATGSEGQA